MLKEMVQAKTGYITKEQWHKALQIAKTKTRSIKDFNDWSKATKLNHIANIMAVWVINEGR